MFNPTAKEAAYEDRFFLQYVTPKEVKKYSRLNGIKATLYLGACTRSPDGYTRQAAVYWLGKNARKGSVGYVLPRLGDWVPEVRAEAQSSLKSLFNAGYASELIECYELVIHLRRVKRVDLTPQIKWLQSILKSDELLNSLRTLLDDQDVAKRLFAYDTLSQNATYFSELAQQAISDRDPLIRVWLARQHLAGNQTLTGSMLDQLVKDKSSRVSLPVLRSLSDERVRNLQPVLRDMANSPSQPIRKEALFYLRKCGVDVLIFAREQTLNGPTPGSIETLGELGDKHDIDSILPHIHRESPRLRSAVITALSLLDKNNEMVDRFVHAMSDPNQKVRKSAFNALRSRPRELWYQSVFNIHESNPSAGSYMAGQLLISLPNWASLPARLIFLMNDKSQEHKGIGIALLVDWLRKQGTKGWIQPDPDIKAQILRIWPLCDHHLEPDRSHHLDWIEVRSTLDKICEP